MMGKLFERYYTWQFHRRRKFFENMLSDKRTGVGQMVEQRSIELAMTMVMRWLDNQRIRHCAVCPGTNTLRRIGDKWWCPGHYDEASQAYENYLKQKKADTEKKLVAV